MASEEADSVRYFFYVTNVTLQRSLESLTILYLLYCDSLCSVDNRNNINAIYSTLHTVYKEFTVNAMQYSAYKIFLMGVYLHALLETFWWILLFFLKTLLQRSTYVT